MGILCPKHVELKVNKHLYLCHPLVLSSPILRWFIDAVCYFANQELPSRSNDKPSTSLSNRHFVEYLKVLKNHGPYFENNLNSATVIQFQTQIGFYFMKFAIVQFK